MTSGRRSCAEYDAGWPLYSRRKSPPCATAVRTREVLVTRQRAALAVAPEAVPVDRLHPSPWNPRTIDDERFVNLCRSIETDREFLWRRPILAQADGTIYAGNMRFRAAKHLGMTTIPAIVEDVPDQLARERALRDNAQWGDWAEDDLARLLAGLRDEGSDLDLLGFDDRELHAFHPESPSPAAAGEGTGVRRRRAHRPR